MAHKLPEADEVFRTFFAPWYTPEDLARRVYSATRPDVESWAAPGVKAVEASPLTPERQREAAGQVAAMVAAASGDWPELAGITGPASLAWIDAFDRHYDRSTVAAVIAASDPTDFSNDLIVLSCEFGAVLGEVLRKAVPTLEWLYDWPYWESGLFDSRHGMRINVFHWAIKKFSDYGIDDGFRAKLVHCQDLIGQGWGSSPVA